MIKGATASGLTIRVDKDGRQVKEACWYLAENHILEIDLVLVIATVEGAVDAGAIVRLTVAETVRGHLIVDVWAGLNPLIVAVWIRVAPHEVEAVFLAGLELEPLAAGSKAARLSRTDVFAPVGHEMEASGLYNVVGHFGLDVAADGPDCLADNILVVVEEEPAAVEKLGNLGLVGVPFGCR